MKTLFPIVLILLLIVPLVSANAWDDIKDNVGSFFTDATDKAGEIVGPLFAEKETATKTLFAILLFMVLYTSVEAVFRKKWYFNVAVTAIVTILATWWMPAEFITSIRTQYGALGATILSIIPFIIILAFTIREKNDLTARVLWLFYAIYYFALLLYSIATGSGKWFSAENIPYFAAIIAGIFLFIFIPAVRKALFKGELKQIREEGEKAALESKVLREIKKRELQGYKDN